MIGPQEVSLVIRGSAAQQVGDYCAKATPEFVAHAVVDEGVEGTAHDAQQTRHQHGEKEV